MQPNATIDNAKEFVTELFKDDHSGHDIDHAMRVYNNAIYIVLFEKDVNVDLEIISLAALLHDVDDYKLFNTENNANARSFLNSQNLNSDKIEKIIEIINGVSFSKNKDKKPNTIEGQIVQDADRLDGIGAIGIMRTISYGAVHGRSFEGSIKHFYDKLLLVKDRLNTNTAKELAESRHKFMLDFVSQYNAEKMYMLK